MSHLKQPPLDLVQNGIDALMKSFYRAVFSIRSTKEPLDEQSILKYFSGRCAYCHKEFTSEQRERLDQIIPIFDRGDPWALHNNVVSCTRCKLFRNGSVVELWMRQTLGPALKLGSDEIERRIRKIYDWTGPYRPLTPHELFGPDAEQLEGVLHDLKRLQKSMVDLLSKAEFRLTGNRDRYLEF